MIMKVACFFSQHSPILGQAGFLTHGMQAVLAHDRVRLEIAFRHRRLDAIQSGFFAAGVSGRCAFSGWRGHGRAVAERIDYGRPCQSPKPFPYRTTLLTKAAACATRGQLSTQPGSGRPRPHAGCRSGRDKPVARIDGVKNAPGRIF